MTNTSLEVIGYVRCDYKEKFGIPRQSGLTGCAAAFIEMLPPYNQAEAFRGLDEFSHIWLLWDFSRAHKNGFTATVKPPKLGGNQRMGVFATRSPFRPNNIGLSSVRLLDIIYNEENGIIYVEKRIHNNDAEKERVVKELKAKVEALNNAETDPAKKNHRLVIVADATTTAK